MHLTERIFSRCAVDEKGCWLWPGATNDKGYGQIKDGGVTLYTHIVTHEEKYGPVPEGLELDHLCRVRRCANPDHTEAVTRLVNVQRGEAGANMRAKVACPQGHPYDEANTIRRRGRRFCRTCKRVRDRVHMRARRHRVHQEGATPCPTPSPPAP